MFQILKVNRVSHTKLIRSVFTSKPMADKDAADQIAIIELSKPQKLVCSGITGAISTTPFF